MQVQNHLIKCDNILFPLISSTVEIIYTTVNPQASASFKKMKASFNVVEPNSQALNYMYGDAVETPKEQYICENDQKRWRRTYHLIIAVLIAVIVSIAVFLAIHYFPMNNNKIVGEKYHQDDRGQKSPTPAEGVLEKRLKNLPILHNMSYLIEPLSYQIYIHLNENYLETTSFHGNVSIELLCKEVVRYIVIGANELGLIGVKLIKLHTSKDSGNNQMDITIDAYDNSAGILIIQVAEALVPSKHYQLQIEYKGHIHNTLYGLFVVQTEIPETKSIKTFLGANTEVPFSRTIFPCFGFPTQISQYSLNICRPKSMISVTSSSLTNSIEDRSESCTWDTFSQSVKLPTRLLGFAITDYTPLKTTTNKNILITIWNSRDTHNGLFLLLEMITKLLDIFETYFEIPFPKNSIDIFCLPSAIPYMSSKSGVIVLRESEAIFTEDMSEYQKERIGMAAAVHVAEQWIDYMVMFDTEDQWLKMSLIQYLQHVAVDLIEPKWRINEEFYISILQPELDAFTFNTKQQDNIFQVNKHFTPSNEHHHRLYPVNETKVFSETHLFLPQLNLPHEERHTHSGIYSELFKRRGIEKGVCLMRSLQHVLTEPIFRKALKQFLIQSQDRIVNSDDLWDLVTYEVTSTIVPGYELLPHQVKLQAIINEWIFNKDYPILKVIRKYGSQTVMFVQFLDDHDNANSFRRLYRHLPISYTTGYKKQFYSTTPRFWLRNVKQTVISNFIDLSNNTWLLVNPQQTGMFRVNYDEHNWMLLKQSFDRKELPTIIRSQLLDDVLYLGFRGYVNYEFAFNFTRSLSVSEEKEYVVWNTALHHFQYIDNIMGSLDDGSLKPYRLKFNDYIKYLLNPIFKTFNFHEETLWTATKSRDHSERLLYADVFNWACKIGHLDCLTKIHLDFTKWKETDDPDHYNPINPNLRYATLCNVIRNTNSTDFEFLLNRYRNVSNRYSNRYVYLKSLYCYEDIDKTIDSILLTTLLNEYSLPHLYEVGDIWRALAENPIKSAAPFEFVVRHWKDILKKFSGYVPILINIIEGATVNLSREDQLNIVYRLKEDVKDRIAQLKEIFSDVIKHTNDRISWKYQQLHVLMNWLTNNVQ